MPDKSLFSKVDHIGVVVKDTDKAVKFYESLGIGPFEPLKISPSRVRKVLGKTIDPDSIQLKGRSASMGQISLELLQPVVGKSLWKEFLDTKGEGINHIGPPLLYVYRPRLWRGVADTDKAVTDYRQASESAEPRCQQPGLAIAALSQAPGMQRHWHHDVRQ